MGPDSAAVEWIAVGVALAAPIAMTLLWDRARRQWWAWVFRPFVIVVAASAALAAGAVAINRSNELYSSWGELFGNSPTNESAIAPGFDPLAQLTGQAPAAGGRIPPRAAPKGAVQSGRVVSFEIIGHVSGITLPAYAYLPPGYDSAALIGERLPVLEVFDGAPGSPISWLKALLAPYYLDREIDAGRMAPTVVVFPYQTTVSNHDSECVNAVGGPPIDTFLTTDVPITVARLFRVRTDAAGWGAIGYSAGAFCAVNLAMRHPDRFAAAVSLSGYFEPYQDAMTGDLFRGDVMARDLNSPMWRLQHLPPPRISLYLASALDDHYVNKGQKAFVAEVRPPLEITVVSVPVGGHTQDVWRELQGPAYDWLSVHLAGPLAG